jgi:hypothetical protein
MRKQIAACLLGVAPWAFAQTGTFDGEWKAHFRSPDQQQREAKVVIKGDGGSWQNLYLPHGADICFKLEVPIEVSSTTAQEITFRGRASKALTGCADGNPVTLKRVDDKTLQGALSDGRPLKLVR